MTDNTATDLQIDWWLRTRQISGEIATSVALEAIGNAEVRLQNLGRTDIRFAFTAISEGTWWVAALDEQLRRGLERSLPSSVAEYTSARNRDEDGQYIRAFLWARNRLSHQLPFSTAHVAEEARRKAGVPSKFSRELVWRASDEFPPVAKEYEDERRRAVYDRLLAHQPINETLYHCASWFHKAAGHNDNWDRLMSEEARRSHAEAKATPDSV